MPADAVVVFAALSFTLGVACGLVIGLGVTIYEFARGKPDPRPSGFGGEGPVPHAAEPAGPNSPR